MTDTVVRLTAAQLDRLALLAQRELQLKWARLRALGVADEDIDAAIHRADNEPRPLTSGGTIAPFGADRYALLAADEDSVTLKRIVSVKLTRSD